MKIIGFSINNLSAKRSEDFRNAGINTNVEFTNIEKEKVEFLKDEEAIKINYKFYINYKKNQQDKESPNLAEVLIEGFLIVAVTKDESKDFLKSWKKKEVPQEKVYPLYNFILKRCSVKALQLEEDLSLPHHLQIPQIKPKNN